MRTGGTVTVDEGAVVSVGRPVVPVVVDGPQPASSARTVKTPQQMSSREMRIITELLSCQTRAHLSITEVSRS